MRRCWLRACQLCACQCMSLRSACSCCGGGRRDGNTLSVHSSTLCSCGSTVRGEWGNGLERQRGASGRGSSTASCSLVATSERRCEKGPQAPEVCVTPAASLPHTLRHCTRTHCLSHSTQAAALRCLPNTDSAGHRAISRQHAGTQQQFQQQHRSSKMVKKTWYATSHFRTRARARVVAASALQMRSMRTSE